MASPKQRKHKPDVPASRDRAPSPAKQRRIAGQAARENANRVRRADQEPTPAERARAERLAQRAEEARDQRQVPRDELGFLLRNVDGIIVREDPGQKSRDLWVKNQRELAEQKRLETLDAERNGG